MSASDGEPRHVGADPHEFRGSIAWSEHGTSPYWATRKLVQELGGGGTFTIEIDGEELDVSLGYKTGGISPRPQDDADQLYEYKIYWHDEHGEKYGGHLKPRFEPEEYRVALDDDEEYIPWSERKPINTPADAAEATVFQVTAGKYKTPDHYAAYLSRILRTIAQNVSDIYWNREYLSSGRDQYSSITQYEVTVRLTREMATKLVRLEGILHRIFHLLGDTEGVKLEYSVDNTEIVGYNHQLRLDRSAASQLFPGTRCGFQIKVYYPKHVRTGEPHPSDPLYYPRIGVLFKKKWNDRTSYPFEDWSDLHRELEENLINILSWGGVPIEPGPTFVSDRYFQNERSEYRVGLYDDPTPEIERRQNSLLVKTFSELIESDRETLQQLATDGGEAHYQELADEVDVGTSTIYRVLERTGDIIESENGIVKFISEKIRQDVLEIIKPLQEDVDAKARAVAHLLDMNPHQLERQGSAFQKWLKKYAIEMDTLEDGTPTFKIAATVSRWKFGSSSRLEDVLQAGRRAWKAAGLDATEFQQAHITWREPGETSYRQGRVRANIR